MKEKFVYPLRVNSSMCKLTQERLKDAGIESRLGDYNQNTIFRIYGANTMLGKRVFVPESKLQEARELLNVTGEEKDNFYSSKSQRPFHRIVKILLIIFLIAWISLSLFDFVVNMQ